MADPTFVQPGEAGGSIFWPNSPTGGYAALQTRRKIAEALLGKRSPYPKNIGEGIASIGESIGDVLAMKSLDERERERDAALTGELKTANENYLRGIGVPAVGTGTPGTTADAGDTATPPPPPPAPKAMADISDLPDAALAPDQTASALPTGRDQMATALLGQGGTTAAPFDLAQMPGGTAAPGLGRGVNARLANAVRGGTSFLPPGYSVSQTSGLRPGDAGQHGEGQALDVAITGPEGAIRNRGDDPTGMYGQLARGVRAYAMANDPGVVSDLGWGGAFGTKQAPSGPGNATADLMHFFTRPGGAQVGNLVLGNRMASLGPPTPIRLPGTTVSPDITGNPPIVTDIPPAPEPAPAPVRVAQAGRVPEEPGPGTTPQRGFAPEPGLPPITNLKEPVPPPQTPPSQAELLAQKNLQAAILSGDPDRMALWKNNVDQLAQRRLYQDQYNKLQYDARVAAWKTDFADKQKARIAQPKQAQELAEGALKLPFVGTPPQLAPGDPRLGTPQSQQRSGNPTPVPKYEGETPEKWGERNAKESGVAQQAYEKAAPQFDQMINLVEQLKSHPGKQWAIGATGKFAPNVPGTAAAGYQTLLDQVKGKTFLNVYQNTLKGGGAGQITNIEGEKATEAYARLANAQNQKDFGKALIDFENAVRSDYEILERRVNQPVTAWNRAGDRNNSAPDKGQYVNVPGVTEGLMEYRGGNPRLPSSYRPISK